MPRTNRKLTDAECLNYLAYKIRQSYTGVSFDTLKYRDGGSTAYRMMYHHVHEEPARSLREAISLAYNNDQTELPPDVLQKDWAGL